MESLEQSKVLKKELLDNINELITKAIKIGYNEVSIEVDRYPISAIKYVETHLSRIQGFDECNRVCLNNRIKYLNVVW